MSQSRKISEAFRKDPKLQRCFDVVLLVGNGTGAERLRSRLASSGLRLVVVPETTYLAGAAALFEPFAVAAECSSHGSISQLVAEVSDSGVYVPFVMIACRNRVEVLFHDARCSLPSRDAGPFLAAAARAAERRLGAEGAR